VSARDNMSARWVYIMAVSSSNHVHWVLLSNRVKTKPRQIKQALDP
jgi:hypothetical protein